MQKKNISCKHLKSINVNEPIDWNDDNSYNDRGYAIRGCCGGGCWVIYGIKYCPFCSIKLKKPLMK